ncbi:MAG: hypothetical protein FVQ84_06800 [Planctomycetes bacterium]|nr:hypothetical protein [Planctomycetota bacterium]
MIVKGFVSFGRLIGLVFILLFSTPVDAQTYFFDDFENPANSEGRWEMITGDWQVADGVYHQLAGADPWQASMVAADQWSNEWEEYTIEFKVKPLTEGDAPVNVLFRVQDPVPTVWADRNGPNTHMYRWIVNGWTNTESRPYIYNAGSTVMLAQTNNSLEVGSWHNIKLVVTKTGMAGYVNDVEMFDVEHAQWTNGRVGIQAYSGMMDFDDFIVYGPGGRKSLPVASGPTPGEGVLIEATWVNLSWRPGDFAVSHDLYIGTDFNEINNGAEGTFAGNTSSVFQVVGFPGFAIPDGLQPGTTYYWRIDEVNDLDPNSPWKGKVWSFAIAPKTAYEPNPAGGAESVDLNVELNWTAGFGSKLHTVYFGESFEEVDNATGGQAHGTATYTPGTLQMAKTYYWRVDEFDGIDTYKGDVWSFTTEGAVGTPSPAKGAVDVTQAPVLTWTAGVFADSHQVYFGIDKDAVKNADTSSPEYKGRGNLGSESYDAEQLEWNTTYYWRIDEANNANADSPWTGPLWSFTTADFLIVDNFESYNDLDPSEPASNRIFFAWVDGFDNPAINGSIVGYANPPFAEQTIVHGGNQSMPFEYNNAVGKSEATLTLTSNRDWTVNGVNTLTIWFRGGSSNAAEQMYVVLNDSAVVNHDDPDAALRTSWTEWNIDLTRFADQGVDLADVNSITLGFGSRSNPVVGGLGMVLFDDIRLYAP